MALIRHFGAMLLLALMWGLSIPVTKLGLQDLPPLTLTALRFAFAVPLMLLFTLGRQAMPLRALPKVAALWGCWVLGWARWRRLSVWRAHRPRLAPSYLPRFRCSS